MGGKKGALRKKKKEEEVITAEDDVIGARKLSGWSVVTSKDFAGVVRKKEDIKVRNEHPQSLMSTAKKKGVVDKKEEVITSDDSDDGIVLKKRKGWSRVFKKDFEGFFRNEEEMKAHTDYLNRQMSIAKKKGVVVDKKEVSTTDDSDDGEPVHVQMASKKKITRDVRVSGQLKVVDANRTKGRKDDATKISLKRKVNGPATEGANKLICSIPMKRIKINGGKDDDEVQNAVQPKRKVVTPKKRGFIGQSNATNVNVCDDLSQGKIVQSRKKTSRTFRPRMTMRGKRKCLRSHPAPVVKKVTFVDEVVGGGNVLDTNDSISCPSSPELDDTPLPAGISAELNEMPVSPVSSRVVSPTASKASSNVSVEFSGDDANDDIEKKKTDKVETGADIVTNCQKISVPSSSSATKIDDAGQSKDGKGLMKKKKPIKSVQVPSSSSSSSKGNFGVAELSSDDEDQDNNNGGRMTETNCQKSPVPSSSSQTKIDDEDQSKGSKGPMKKRKSTKSDHVERTVLPPEYDTPYWIKNAKTPSAEELSKPIRLEVATMANLNRYRWTNKMYKIQDGKPRWQCPSCPRSYTTEEACQMHISKGNEHTLYGRCLREGCTGFFHDPKSLLEHMEWHWDKDMKCKVIYDEDTKTFRDRVAEDLDEDGLRDKLLAKTVAYNIEKKDKKEQEGEAAKKVTEEAEKKKRRSGKKKDFLEALKKSKGPTQRKEKKTSRSDNDDKAD